MKKLAAILVAFVALAALGVAAAAMSCESGLRCVFLPVVATPRLGPPTAVPTATLNPRPETIVGLAVLGDSTQDEYRADDARGGEYSATTLSWVEQLVTVRGVNLGSWGARGEPRRGGYAFNWARSGATSQQMISTGQHTGAAKQALDGKVSHAAIQIGINDLYFGGLGEQIYANTISEDDLHARLDYIADNIATAARTLKETNRCEVLVASTQDYISIPVVPELYTTFQDVDGRRRLVEAMSYLNEQIRKRSERDGVSFFDFNAAYLSELNARFDREGFLIVGGERIDLRTRGDEPHFGLLDDGYVHPGTVLSGLYAKVFIEAFNRTFQTAIVPLSDDDILRAAGIRP